MRSLDGTYTRLLRKALNVSYAQHVRNVDLYGSIPRPTQTLIQRRLGFAGHCFRRTDQPIHDLMLWQPRAKYKRGHHRTMTFVASMMKDTGFSKEELGKAMLDRDQWSALVRRTAVGVRKHK